MKNPIGIFVLLCLSAWGNLFAQTKTEQSKALSEWVYPGANGRLIYKTTPAGDKIMDFSHAGYKGGGVKLPQVPVKRTIKPSGGTDDTNLIQKAIDEISSLPLKNGFRGAVLLAPGTFTCSQSLTIAASGVVLRGSGSGLSDKNSRTTIKMTGSRHAAVFIGKGKNTTEISEDEELAEEKKTVSQISTSIADAYVPSGSSSFNVTDARGFSVGDRISIIRPVTKPWVTFMQMHNLVRDGRPQTWIGLNRTEITERTIATISGNTFTLDIPLSDSYDAAYLNPPGTFVAKAAKETALTDIGIEHLHIQCDPLEISYGQAPYSGVRIDGDDCWVKDIYFQETMNTTTLTGKRITMQQLVITHTFPNLGASKPTDFSIEGSQILIDRCNVTGGNTYFVWTSSLKPGPNVVLNSTFNGHGSRIQPHQRWSTGMLVDNCKVPDGGIDFMNRGVAGSGHGWTMGWAVAWNCLAKTYIIQNPPGALNWAIGCVGTRMQTARLFDSSPILAEGVFESHGKNIAPQSLYLAQLSERLGKQALKNIGYASNTENEFIDKSLHTLPPLPILSDSVLGRDLAQFRPVNTSNVRGKTREYGGEKALDGNAATYWTTTEGTTKGVLEVDMENPVELNALIISEPTGMEHVQQYKVEAQVNSDWTLIAEGNTIGERKEHRFPDVTAWKVRLTILQSDGSPAIRRFGLFRTGSH